MAFCSTALFPFLFAAVLLLAPCCRCVLAYDGDFNPAPDETWLPPSQFPCNSFNGWAWPCPPPPPPLSFEGYYQPPIPASPEPERDRPAPKSAPPSPRPPPSPPTALEVKPKVSGGTNNWNATRTDGTHQEKTSSSTASAVGWSFLAAALALQVVLGTYLAYKRWELERLGVRLEKVPSVSPPPSPAGFAPYTAAR